MNEIKLAYNPRFSLFYANGNNEIIENNKNSFLGSCNMNAELEIGKDFKYFNANIQNHYVSGFYPDIKTSFKGQHRDYQVVTNQLQDNHIRLIKSLCRLSFKKCSDRELQIRIGVTETISRDLEGQFKGGWFIDDCREYYGEGFTNNIYPFIMNLLIKGIQLRYINKKITYYFDIGNKLEDAYKVISVENNSQGFLSTTTPYLLNTGFVYKTNIPCKSQILIGLQKFDNHKHNIEEDEAIIERAAYTKNCELALIDTIKEKGYMNSYTIIGCTEYKNIKLNGNITCFNTQKKIMRKETMVGYHNIV